MASLRIIFTILALFWIGVESGDQARAGPVRLVWEGIDGAEAYEVVVATDPQFKQVRKATRVTSGLETLDVPGGLGGSGRVYAKIRAVFTGGIKSEWNPLRIGKWQAPRLPKRVRIRSDEAGEKEARWKTPKGTATRGDLTYHVRIVPASDAGGAALYDGLVVGETFRIPELPGGDYILTVEAVGAARTGTLHEPAGAAVGKTWIAADPIAYDPNAGKEKIYDLVTMTDLFRGGFAYLATGEYVLKERSTQIDWISDFSWAFEKLPLTLSLSLPVVLMDERNQTHGNQSSWNPAPRVGGDPYPTLRADFRIVGGPERYLGVGASFLIATNSSSDESTIPNVIMGYAPFRWTAGWFIVNGSLHGGSSLPSTQSVGGPSGSSFVTIQPILSFGGSLYPGALLMNRRLMVGVGAYFNMMGEVQANPVDAPSEVMTVVEASTTLMVSPYAAFQLTNWAYVEASARIGLADPNPIDEVENSYRISVGLVF